MLPSFRRVFVLAAGTLVALLGLILMPVPGPGGTPVFLAGLAMLATECQWARQLLARFKQAYSTLGHKKRRVLTVSLLVFYLTSGIAAWNWANRSGSAIAREVSRA